MLFEFFAIIVGLFLLVSGALLVVKGAKRIAKRVGISEVVIGLTIISIGTSLPEIAVMLKTGFEKAALGAAGLGIGGVAVGTTIGSCLAQITLILGITGMFGNIKASHRTLKRDGIILLLAILIFWFFAAFFNKNGGYYFYPLEGIFMVALYVGFLSYLGSKEKTAIKQAEALEDLKRVPHSKMGMIRNGFLLLSGIALLIIGSEFVVDNAVTLARTWNISETIIGLLIIGVGTALPELTTAITAILKGSHGISVGTIIGSNITDPLFSLGLGAMISGFSVERAIVVFDIPFWFFATGLALFLMMRKGRVVNRSEAGLLIGVYALFVILRLSSL